LVSKRGGSWILHYVKSAYAITDVPDQVPELISQRRRWLNGSFFAAVHSTFHFHYIYRSSHTFLRKFWIHIEMVYQCYNLIFSWFSLVRLFSLLFNAYGDTDHIQGNYYIAFVILTNALEDYISSVHYVNLVLNYFYLGLLITCFLLSLGNRPQGAKWAYTLAFVGFALITIYMTVRSALVSYSAEFVLTCVIGLGVPSCLQGCRGCCSIRGSGHSSQRFLYELDFPKHCPLSGGYAGTIYYIVSLIRAPIFDS
jgi:chitin synthase